MTDIKYDRKKCYIMHKSLSLWEDALRGGFLSQSSRALTGNSCLFENFLTLVRFNLCVLICRARIVAQKQRAPLDERWQHNCLPIQNLFPPPACYNRVYNYIFISKIFILAFRCQLHSFYLTINIMWADSLHSIELPLNNSELQSNAFLWFSIEYKLTIEKNLYETLRSFNFYDWRKKQIFFFVLRHLYNLESGSYCCKLQKSCQEWIDWKKNVSVNFLLYGQF